MKALATDARSDRRGLATRVSHVVPYDSPVDRRGTALALCGERVHADREHSNTPTCEHCQQRNAELDAMEF